MLNLLYRGLVGTLLFGEPTERVREPDAAKRRTLLAKFATKMRLQPQDFQRCGTITGRCNSRLRNSGTDRVVLPAPSRSAIRRKAPAFV